MLPGDVQRGQSFAEFAGKKPAPWRVRAAEQQFMELQKSALGRNNTYREVVGAYCDFLNAIIQNESPENLRSRLSIAEARYLAAYAEVMGLNKDQKEK